MDYESVAKAKGFLRAASREFSLYLDAQDPLKEVRNEFERPAQAGTLGSPCLYLCGGSLGLLPRRTRTLINEELDVWASLGVQGHIQHPLGRPWIPLNKLVIDQMALLAGAHSTEVVAMNALTVNIHLLLASFYKPSGRRCKIMIEKGTFSSDYYAIVSHVRWHALDPKNHVLVVSPVKGHLFTTECILETIDKYEKEIAVIFLPGIHYYTGQVLDMCKITKYARSKGIIIGWDLAHAIGNIELKLHEWDIDFAVWCTYKYLNSGPGGIGGIFVHERHANNPPRLLGWWGNDQKTRFDMNNEQFDLLYGALGYQISNPSVFSLVSLMGSLEIFSKVSMSNIRQKSILLTGYLEYLLLSLNYDTYFTIITPKNFEERGAQLSLSFSSNLVQTVFNQLQTEGVIVDLRKPTVIRVMPAPLYNTFEDVFNFVSILKKILDSFSA